VAEIALTVRRARTLRREAASLFVGLGKPVTRFRWKPSFSSQEIGLNFYFLRSLHGESATCFETPSLPTLRRCYPSQLYLDHSHCLVLAPATLAALPSTRAIPDRDVFYVAHPVRSVPERLALKQSELNLWEFRGLKICG
jgi:hypothetical protein